MSDPEPEKCPHSRVAPEVVDQTIGVKCLDCGGLLATCWRDEHVPESLWNKACENSDKAKRCEQDRDDVCAICAEILNVKCNLCGHLCALGEAKQNEPDRMLGGLLGAQVNGGHYSTAGNGYGALEDGCSYRFSLCEFCLDWLFNQFKVPVKVHDYIDGDPAKWEAADERVKRYAGKPLAEVYRVEADKRAKSRGKPLNTSRADVAYPMCAAPGCTNLADPRWFIHTATGALPACDGHGCDGGTTPCNECLRRRRDVEAG